MIFNIMYCRECNIFTEIGGKEVECLQCNKPMTVIGWSEKGSSSPNGLEYGPVTEDSKK
jgi:hypothetical protein